jgi:hypothetical protein
MRALGGLDSPFQRSSTPVQNPYSDPSLLESDADKSFSQSTLRQTAQKQKRLQGNESVIAQREQEINDIANGIIELADIFKDLQTMVIDQGTMLDRIDYNVEKMTVDVKAAEKELTTVSLRLFPSLATWKAVPNGRRLTHLLIIPPLIGHRLPAKVHEAKNPTPTTPACRWLLRHPTHQTQEINTTSKPTSTRKTRLSESSLSRTHLHIIRRSDVLILYPNIVKRPIS